MKSFVKNVPTPDPNVSVATTTTVAPPAASPLQQAVAADAALQTAVVVRPSLAVGSVSTSARFEGEMGASDINKPVLTIVHGVGPRSMIYSPGTVVIGESVVFNPPERPADPTGKVRLVFGKVRKDYVESLPYGDGTGPRPRIFPSESDVLALGGTTAWIGNVPPTFIARVSCIALVRCPANAVDDSLFVILDGESAYSPALVAFQKTSYPAARTLLTDLQLRLKFDPTSAYYDLFWAREKKGANFVYCAKLERVREEVPSDGVKRRLEEICGRAKSSDFDNVDE